MIAIAVDGVDTPQAGCTTHFASLLALEFCREGFCVDIPWLIRLNPSIPMKTRGNGAVVLWLEACSETKLRIVKDKIIDVFRNYVTTIGSEEKATLLIVEFSDEKLPRKEAPLTTLYLRSTYTFVPRDNAIEMLQKLKEHNINIHVVKGLKSIVGALSALGAQLDIDYTYELLIYAKPDYWFNKPKINEKVLENINIRLATNTYANIDYLTGRILVQPRGTDPVLAGIRFETFRLKDEILAVIENIKRYATHYVIFRTNQHTGIHVRDTCIDKLRPYTCGRIRGVVYEQPRELPGGHVKLRVCDGTGCIDAVFYRETKPLTIAARMLRQNSIIALEGCTKPHADRITFNVERLYVISSTRYEQNIEIEPPPSTWHHLFKPRIRKERIPVPKPIELTNPQQALSLLNS